MIFEKRYQPGKLPLTTRLIDFGFAMDKNDPLYKQHGLECTFFGSPCYIAPEKLRNEPLEEKSDNWSVGVMAYQMLVGKLPFLSNQEEELYQKIKTCDYDFC